MSYRVITPNNIISFKSVSNFNAINTAADHIIDHGNVFITPAGGSCSGTEWGSGIGKIIKKTVDSHTEAELAFIRISKKPPFSYQLTQLTQITPDLLDINIPASTNLDIARRLRTVYQNS